jgi:osmotically-inducible protein OsmY
VSQGIASLSGQVASLLARERAVAVGESIRGVRSVVDQITVAPIARTDEQIKADVAVQLKQDLATRGHAITVSVKDGKVTLSGSADSWQQKNLFADVAKTVKGVRALDNAVAVHYDTTRPEAEIATDVKHRIVNDVWLDSDVLTVAVSGKTVHVSGTVGSAAQRTRARSDAWVAGVEGVDDTGIIVDWSAQDDQRHSMDYAPRSDAEISQAIRDALRVDPRLGLVVPQVAVQAGVVTLTGTVDGALARRAAERDATDTVGVWRVHNATLVQPRAQPTDSDLERTVKRALAEDFFLSDSKSIQVSSVKGKVLLKGSVPSEYERFNAVDDALSIPGVAEVDMGLVVKLPPEEIKARVEDQLFWDPRVGRDRVTVTVGPDGVATLGGTLDAWSEIKAAADDALTAGAARVINVLKLKRHPEVIAPQ